MRPLTTKSTPLDSGETRPQNSRPPSLGPPRHSSAAAAPLSTTARVPEGAPAGPGTPALARLRPAEQRAAAAEAAEGGGRQRRSLTAPRVRPLLLRRRRSACCSAQLRATQTPPPPLRGPRSRRQQRSKSCPPPSSRGLPASSPARLGLLHCLLPPRLPPPLLPLAATLKEVAPAAPLPQKPKLTGMAAFDVAERYSFDVAGSGGGAREPRAAPRGRAEESTKAALLRRPSSAPQPPPLAPPPPPPQPLRSGAPSTRPSPRGSRWSPPARWGGPEEVTSAGVVTLRAAARAPLRRRRARRGRASRSRPRTDLPRDASRAPPPPPPCCTVLCRDVTWAPGGPRQASDEFCPHAGLFGEEGSSSASPRPPRPWRGVAPAARGLGRLPPFAAFLPDLQGLFSGPGPAGHAPARQSLLWRLWGLKQKGERKEEKERRIPPRRGATAIADELAAPGAGAVMKVARLADGSAWALTSPAATRRWSRRGWEAPRESTGSC